ICFQVNMQTKAYSGRYPKKNRTSRPGQNGCSTLLNQSAYARHTIAQHYNIALPHTRLELNETVLALPHFHFQCFSGINRRGKAHIEANQTAGVVSAQSLEHRMSGHAVSAQAMQNRLRIARGGGYRRFHMQRVRVCVKAVIQGGFGSGGQTAAVIRRPFRNSGQRLWPRVADAKSAVCTAECQLLDRGQQGIVSCIEELLLSYHNRAFVCPLVDDMAHAAAPHDFPADWKRLVETHALLAMNELDPSNAGIRVLHPKPRLSQD